MDVEDQLVDVRAGAHVTRAPTKAPLF